MTHQLLFSGAVVGVLLVLREVCCCQLRIPQGIPQGPRVGIVIGCDWSSHTVIIHHPRFFLQIDLDGSGSLTKQEFFRATKQRSSVEQQWRHGDSLGRVPLGVSPFQNYFWICGRYGLVGGVEYNYNYILYNYIHIDIYIVMLGQHNSNWRMPHTFLTHYHYSTSCSPCCPSQPGKIRNKLRALDILPKDIDELWDILDDGKGEWLVMQGGAPKIAKMLYNSNFTMVYRWYIMIYL